jgi:hypothetical protein
MVAAFLGISLAAAFWQSAARHLPLPTLHPSQVLPASFWMKGNVHKDLASLAARSAKSRKVLAGAPAVYPYSIVPGGIKDADDLRYAALRDYVVRRHYARFNFANAHFVHAEAREVYLSYRIRNTVFWTRKKVRLHPGELLMTDGKITARARCGNQISDTAKPEVSKEEPEEDILDEPVVAMLEPGPSFPIRPMLTPPDLPIGVPTPPQMFTGGFAFPYVPMGLPAPSGLCRPGDHRLDGRCTHKNPVVPEPSTLFLLGTGLALIAWRYKAVSRP